jgi:hypothetical protein
MDAVLLSLVSAAIGAALTVAVQRVQATWLKRRDTAAEAYSAAVAMHSSVVTSLAFVRRIDTRIRANLADLAEIADSSDWYLRGHLDGSKARIANLREARLNIHSIWGAHVGSLFDDFFDLTCTWHNALGTYWDDIHGTTGPYDGVWDEDATGFKWADVISAIPPHAEAFEQELEKLMDLIRQFARSAGVVITDLLELPQGVREVLTEYEDHRARRPRELPVGR